MASALYDLIDVGRDPSQIRTNDLDAGQPNGVLEPARAVVKTRTAAGHQGLRLPFVR